MIKSSFKLASTQTILKNDPFFLKKKHQRIASFDLANFLRKENYMKELRGDDNDGPLKIIKLPTATAPILLMSDTPQILRDLGLHGKDSMVNSLEINIKNGE